MHGIWTYLAGAATISAALLASGHAVLHKREVRAAVGWVGLIWLVPVAGAVLYLVMGVNRIGRRGTRIHATMHRLTLGRGTQAPGEPGRLPLPFIDEAMVPLSRVVDRVTRTAVTPGNQIDPLVDGDEAYPAMLEAIESARSTVALCSYIFDQDRVGRQFEDALARATGRGVEVRVRTY